MLNGMLRRGLESVLRRRGYELKEIGTPLRGFAACLAYAKALGLTPMTVIDIGVGWGTPWLYDAFPDAKLVLVEPLATFNAALDAIVARYDADVHRVALWNGGGTATFHFNIEAPTSSSLLELDPAYARLAAHSLFDRRTVPVETLDKLNHYEPPYVLKLDVEGAELAVLEGGCETLEHTDLVIAEVSVMRRTVSGPRFAEIVHFLDGRGYELFDIPSMTQVKRNGGLVYLDAAFVRRDGPLARAAARAGR